MTKNGGAVDRGTDVSTISDGSVFGGSGADVRDTTAGELFRELRDEEAADGPDAAFGESADDIVADAEGHGYERFTDGGQAIAAGSELNDLLIPDRQEGDEFHWVDPDHRDDPAEAAAVDGPDGSADGSVGTEPAGSESTPDSGGLLDAVLSLFGRR